MINLKQEELRIWQERNFPRSRYESMGRDELIDMIITLQCVVGMSEEVGEICHHVLKGTQGIRGGVVGINKAEVGDGFGDVNIFGTQLCSMLKLNAESEISKATEQVLDRDWIDMPNGTI